MAPAEDRDKHLQAESARRRASDPSSRGPGENPLDQWPIGRMERRLPVIVVVRLAPAVSAPSEEEKAFTDNISPHGARIVSKQVWRPGDMVRITPLSEDAAYGKVVYSQKLPDNRYVIGVQFPDRPVAWPPLQRFDSALK